MEATIMTDLFKTDETTEGVDVQELSKAEQRVFEYLDECYEQGKPVPTIRQIREAVKCSNNVISPVLKTWTKLREDKDSQRDPSERLMSDATREAFNKFATLLVEDAKRIQAQCQTEIEAVRAESERKQSELSTLFATTSASLNAQLIRVGELSNELKHLNEECEQLKKERQEARRAEEVAKDKLERAQQRFKDEMSEAHREIKRLQAIVNNK